jgi:hypothetical protein
MKISLWHLPVLACVSLAASQLVQAQTVVYSTIDPNATTYTYSSGSISYPILNHPTGSPPGVYQSYGDQFSPTFNFTLSSITFGVRTIPSNNFGDLNAVIYANDPNTNLPLTGSPLAISTAVAPMGTGSAQTVPLTMFDFSGASLPMLAGQTYWIALEPGREGTDVDWGYTTNGTNGRVAENTGGGYHQFTMGGLVQNPQFGAFQIFAVPEPSTVSLLTVTTLALFAYRMKRLPRR